MPNMHEFLATAPFDLYELHLFHLVAEHQSFTKAAAVAGLTQSAVTRQMQGIEQGLGVELFERTTRSVRLTAAGILLRDESERLLGGVQGLLQRVREDFAGARKQVSVGVSRSIGLAYLPGFFHANLRKLPTVGYRVSSTSSTAILNALDANRMDLGVLCPPPRLPATVRVTHRFQDAFVLIASGESAATFNGKPKERRQWAARQNWLVLDGATNTGRRLRSWMGRQSITIEPSMELDSFDLIINLVALGMGVSFVPIRALALYSRKRAITRLPWPERFERELVVVMRRNRKIPAHLAQFVDNVLF